MLSCIFFQICVFSNNFISYIILLFPFFNRTGLKRVGVVGQDLDCCWVGLLALTLLSSSKKNKKEEGPAGGSPVAAPMPKSVPR